MPPVPILKAGRLGNTRGKVFRLAFPAVVFGALISGCTAQIQPYVANSQGSAAIPINSSFWGMLGIAAAILIVITLLLQIAIFRGRQGGQKTTQAQPGDRRALTWAVIGGAGFPLAMFLMAIALGITSKNTIATSENTAADRLTIQVIGHQWWWEVKYPQDGFTTANEIHIPVGRAVTFQLTSADVIHSFWVPQLHPRQDMLPGKTSSITLRADTTGTYQGECSEYCGIQHAHMEFIIIAQPQADYDKWIQQQKQPAPAPPVGSLEKKGEQAFLGSSCVYCHTIQGTNASGTLGPDLTHLASRATLGAGARPNTPDNLAGWVINSQAIKPGNKMPPMNLDSDQLQAILVYLESLK